MSQAQHSINLNEAELLDHSRALRVAVGSGDLFPDSLNTLQPEMIHEHDKQALLIMGAIGINSAFDTLDQWIRFRRAETAALETELQTNPRSPYAAIQRAARYITGLRLTQIIPGLNDSRPLDDPDPNLAFYQRNPLYRQISTEAQFKPQEVHLLNRVRAVKISIFAENLHNRAEQL